jgi:hypothetical protein
MLSNFLMQSGWKLSTNSSFQFIPSTITTCTVTYTEHSDVDLCSVEIVVGFVAILFMGFLGYLGL